MAKMFFPVVLFCFVFIAQSGKLSESLKAQLDEIKHFELIHFKNLDSLVVGNPTNILEFDAFGQHFKFELTLRDNAPSVINHPQRSSDLPSVDQHELCHYKGEVIEPSHPYGTQYVSISFCSERGVRAFITLHNESLMIHPAAYHFNPHSDPPNGHQLHHTHLIYKHSDNFATRPVSKMLSLFEQKLEQKMMGNTRRRLPYNAKNSVELYIFVDPSYCDEWKDKGSSWYSKMFNWVQDFVNAASDEYERCDWGYKSGTWELQWVRFDVAESYNGEFRGMKYDYDRDEYDGRDEGSGYRRLFRDWSRKNVDQEFDFGAIYTYQGSGGGAAWKSGVCGSNKFMNSQSTGTASRQRKLLAHELGHCLGMNHDERSECCDDDGAGSCDGCDYLCPDGNIMGDGDYNKGWSSCSKKYLRDFMDDEDGLSCTKASSKSLVSNKGGGGSTNNNNNDDNGDDNGDDDRNSGSDSGECISVSSLYMNGKRLDGEYKATGKRYNGQMSYKHKSSSLYLYQLHDDDWYWTISSNLGKDTWSYGWCDRTDIKDCDGDWDSYDGDDDDCKFRSCGGLTSEVDECLIDNPYTDAVCVYDGLDANTSYAMYQIDSERGCAYKQPVYVYENEEEGRIQYLHYNQDGEWVISINAVIPSGQFSCANENLLDCTEGTWQMDKERGDVEYVAANPTMTVKACGNSMIGLEQKEEKKSVSITAVVFIALTVVVIVLIVGLLSYFVMQKKNTSKVDRKMIQISDEEEEEIVVEADVEQEVQVESRLNTE